MGNWGNTLDRWYHRAAVVVWPRDQDFANRAQASPAWALDEVAAMASPGARAAAATLAPFWDSTVTAGGDRASRLLGQALLTADAVADADIAAMLLRSFHIENLTDGRLNAFVKIADGHGHKQRRQHVHSRIDAAELPVTHVTRRQGSPYTLVLEKTEALFTREQEARAKDETGLGWLTASWHPGVP